MEDSTAKEGDSSPSQRGFDQTVSHALGLAVSREEFDALHKYLRARQPRLAKGIESYRRLVPRSHDHNHTSLRISLRILLGSVTALQVWDAVRRRLITGARKASTARSSLIRSLNLRLSLSLSTIFFLHRVLYRFLHRLRSNLLSKEAAPFRRRNHRISRTLTSRLTPAIGASLAGAALAIYPADQLRLTIAIYFSTRSLEFLYNALDSDGWFHRRPRWWGSWMLTPFATGQLLYAFVFDRDCVPTAYTNFILDHTPNYVQKRLATYPDSLPWPSTNTIVDGLKEMSLLNWPPFSSPILFPNIPQTLPSTLTQLSPITSPAHPAHTALSCATLHPADPSCVRTSAQYTLLAFPKFAKFFAAFYALLSIPKYRKIIVNPGFQLTQLARKVLRTTTFVTGAIGTSWASTCLFQYILSRTFVPKARWFLGGALGGLWAYVDRENGRGQVMYSMRASIDSLWKVGKKRGWWRGMKGGDVTLFVVSLALMNLIHERRPDAIDQGIGKGLRWMKGEKLWSTSKDEAAKEKRV